MLTHHFKEDALVELRDAGLSQAGAGTRLSNKRIGAEHSVVYVPTHDELLQFMLGYIKKHVTHVKAVVFSTEHVANESTWIATITVVRQKMLGPVVRSEYEGRGETYHIALLQASGYLIWCLK